VKSKLILKLVALGGMMLALFALLASAAKPGVVSATANPLPPLVICPNLDGSTEPATMPPDPTKLGKVSAADILVVQQHYGKSYGQSGYFALYDPVSPYNSTSPTSTGRIAAVDILYVQQRYGLFCPIVDTQIAEATRAISEPLYSNILCDPAFATRVPCGGDPQFLTVDPANPAFLTSKGYRQASTDVPGQGIHYVNMSLWDGVFNPARPEGLVYKNMVIEDPGIYSGSCTDGLDNSAADPLNPGGDGLADGADPDCQVYRLVAQLYYAEGDVINWSPNRDNNVRGVNTDSFCTPAAGEPPGIGCSWNGTNDGFHWHAYLCTWAIGTSSATAYPLPPGSTQSTCASYATAVGHTCTAFYPAAGWNCTFKAAVGYMGHLWNWLPNANYTSGNDPGPSGLGDCQAPYCNTLENNGRFADCFPDPVGGPWLAYNCPQ
jgi:hypothetical protein